MSNRRAKQPKSDKKKLQEIRCEVIGWKTSMKILKEDYENPSALQAFAVLRDNVKAIEDIIGACDE